VGDGDGDVLIFFNVSHFKIRYKSSSLNRRIRSPFHNMPDSEAETKVNFNFRLQPRLMVEVISKWGLHSSINPGYHIMKSKGGEI
jgi:hypothetical protein